MDDPTPASSSSGPMIPSTPKTSSELKREGNELVKQRDYAGAVATYTEAIRVSEAAGESTTYLLHSNRAQAYINAKEYGKAMQDAERAIELKQDWFKGYSHKATILLKWEKYDDILDVAAKGLQYCERESDGEVLRQNMALAKTGIFLRKIEGSWTGRVKDVMGGYRQTLEFHSEGRLTVKIMHRMQHCHYSARVHPPADPTTSPTTSSTPAISPDGVFVISFILPNVDNRTPYLARLIPGNESASGEQELHLCCNADVVKSAEVPALKEIFDMDCDGMCVMKRASAVDPLAGEKGAMSLSDRVEKFAEGYHKILQDPGLMTWTTLEEAQLQSDPHIAAQSIKLQSHVFDLEEEWGMEVVDAFFLLVCDFDEDKRKLGLPVNTTPSAKAKVVQVREILTSKGMLDFSILQSKKERYLESLKADIAKDGAGIGKNEASKSTVDGGAGGGSSSSAPSSPTTGASSFLHEKAVSLFGSKRNALVAGAGMALATGVALAFAMRGKQS